MKSILEEFGYSKFDIENRVIECWNNIFDQKNPNHFYFESDDNTGYMEDTGNDDARTEGMSYGMMMAVQMNRKDIFDRIWKWSKKYMYMESGPNAGYFCWSNKPDGTKNAEGPAPDGEEYFAMALFFAARRWGDGEGVFNYTEQAREILRSFFEANTPRSFTVTHKASESNKKYLIGLLNAGGELFQVTIYATASAGDTYKIQQLNISRQTAY